MDNNREMTWIKIDRYENGFATEECLYKIRKSTPCSLAMKCQGTVIYTIVDFERNVRGMDNYVFGIYDYYSDEDCEQALQELISGEMEVSYRSYVELDITKVK